MEKCTWVRLNSIYHLVCLSKYLNFYICFIFLHLFDYLQPFHYFYWTFQDQKYLNRQKCPIHVIWVISITHMCALCEAIEFFLNEAELSLNSVNSGNLINHWSMNWSQFKDPVPHMCLAGAVAASWSLTQEVVGSSLLLTNIFCHWFRWIQWKHLGKTPLS